MTTRTWVNGVVSNNSQWAGKNYNVEKVTGGRIAIGQKFCRRLESNADLQLSAPAHPRCVGPGSDHRRRDGADGNSGERPRALDRSPNNVVRFGPEFKQYYVKTLDFHLDGDVGIGDLVYASTYWAQDDHWTNEYSEYMQYVNTGPPPNLTRAIPSRPSPAKRTRTGGAPAPYSGCNVPTQYYDYDPAHRSLVQRIAPAVEGGRPVPLAGRRLLGEDHRPLSPAIYHMPGLQTAGQAWQSETPITTIRATVPPKPDDWYSYDARSDYLQTTEFANVIFDITPKLHVEAGTVHFHSTFHTSTYGGFWYHTAVSERLWRVSAQVEQQGGHQLQASWTACSSMPMRRRASGTAASTAGIPSSCTANGVPAQVHAGYPDQLRARLEVHHARQASAVERRRVLHAVEESAVPAVRSRTLPVEQLQRQYRQCPGLRHGIRHQVPGERVPEHGVLGKLQRLASPDQ